MVDTGLAPLRSLAPGAYAALERAYTLAAAALDPDLRGRVEALLAGAAPDAEAHAGACVDLTDRFVTYVPGVTDELRAAVRDELGEAGLRTLVEALYVVDQTERLRHALGGLFGDEAHDAPPPLPAAGAADLHGAVDDLHAAAVHLPALDPVTTELVRLRCARYHDCKT
jgi:hypothetical protein